MANTGEENVVAPGAYQAPSDRAEEDARAAVDALSSPRLIHSLDEIDLPMSLIEDLILKRALVEGHTSTLALATALCVSPLCMEELLEGLRHLQYFEVDGMRGRNWLLSLTDLGRAHATDRMNRCSYVGALPVSLDQYTAIVLAQAAEPSVDRALLRRAFADLVISDGLLDELGPAIGSRGAIFLYGPPGTGKSAIAERLIRVLDDEVLVPHAVSVDGQVITVFDPVLHRPSPTQAPGLDRRWVQCGRPAIIAGGELGATELDLTYEQHSGIYVASLQMQANGGLLVVDDFGRQQLAPAKLLNRWIVPLDRGVDYLSLTHGVKFQVPFTAKVVFSTNLEPRTLGDEAFFRRIRSKVLIPPVTDSQFDEVLCIVAERGGMDVAPDVPAYLRDVSRARGDGDLRPYLPGTVCDLAASICAYEQRAPLLDKAMVDRIVHLYFTKGIGWGDAADLPADANPLLAHGEEAP